MTPEWEQLRATLKLIHLDACLHFPDEVGRYREMEARFERIEAVAYGPPTKKETSPK